MHTSPALTLTLTQGILRLAGRELPPISERIRQAEFRQARAYRVTVACSK